MPKRNSDVRPAEEGQATAPEAGPTAAPKLVLLGEVDIGSRVRIDAEIVGQGGNIGRAVQVGHWRGPVAVSIPVRIVGGNVQESAAPTPDMTLPRVADDQGPAPGLVPLADVPAGRRVRVELDVTDMRVLIGRVVRVGDWRGPVPRDLPVALLPE